jgi:hypothetical protein
MWVLAACTIAVLVGVPAVLVLTRRGSPRLTEQPWLLYDTAKLHVSIMGGLAGFAVTGIVLLVGLARTSPAIATGPFNTVIAMFVVAYFYYVGNAFLISYLPDRATSGDLAPRVHFSLASTIEYRTLFISWFALLPLLEAHGLEEMAHVLAFLLPASLLLGSVIIAVAADGLGLMHLKETYVALLIGTVLGLAAAAYASMIRPALVSADSAFWMTIAIFAINLVGFAFAALTSLSRRYASLERFYDRFGRRLVIVDMQVTMIALTLLWLAVVRVI